MTEQEIFKITGEDELLDTSYLSLVKFYFSSYFVMIQSFNLGKDIHFCSIGIYIYIYMRESGFFIKSFKNGFL